MTAGRVLGLALMLTLAACDGGFLHTSAQLRLAADKHDPSELRASLEQVAAWHGRNETGVLESLRPGRSDTRALRINEHCELSDELAELWAWRDGAEKELPFVWYHDFMALDEAIADYRWLRAQRRFDWDPRYLPFLRFDGEWYAAYCGAPARQAGPIAHYGLVNGSTIVAINLTTFMGTMAELFQKDAVRWENGAMEDDLPAIYTIFKANNPGYEFPYYVP